MIMTTSERRGVEDLKPLFSFLPSPLPTEIREMADVLEQYSSLSPSSSSSDINAVLGRIINGEWVDSSSSRPVPSLQRTFAAGQDLFDDKTRISLIELLLKDIAACAQNLKSNKLKISAKGSRPQFPPFAVLSLTRRVEVAQAVLALKMLGRNTVGSDLITRPPTMATLISAAEAFKDTPNATSEVLRCIANGLLLVPDSRSTFVTKEVGGGPAVLGTLEVRTRPPV